MSTSTAEADDEVLSPHDTCEKSRELIDTVGNTDYHWPPDAMVSLEAADLFPKDLPDRNADLSLEQSIADTVSVSPVDVLVESTATTASVLCAGTASSEVVPPVHTVGKSNTAPERVAQTGLTSEDLELLPVVKTAQEPVLLSTISVELRPSTFYSKSRSGQQKCSEQSTCTVSTSCDCSKRNRRMPARFDD